MSSLKERDYDQNKYIAIDIENFFKENDEFNMLKTLQEMYVSSYNLELEMKSLVTNELDSVLLCVDTILQMCNLIKQSKSNLDTISKMSNEYNYDLIFKEACKNKINIEDLGIKELKRTLDSWMKTNNRERIEDEIYKSNLGKIRLENLNLFLNYDEFVEKCKNVSVHMQSLVSEHLHGMTMNNYKFLKKNELINSYELLFVKIPLMLNLLSNLGGFEYNSLTRETERMCGFCKSKLRSHCIANLKTNNTSVLLESISVIFLLYGKKRETINYLLKRRLELYNIAASSLVTGSLTVLSQLFLHFFANEVMNDLLSLVLNEPPSKNSIFSEGYESKLIEHLTCYNLIKLVEVKKFVLEKVSSMDVEFNNCNVKDRLAKIREFLSTIFERTWSKCVNDKISNTISTISATLNNYMKIKTDLDNFSEYFDNEDFIENKTCDIEATISELNEFLLSDSEFNRVVDSKLDSTLDKVNKQIQARQFKHTQISSLTLYSIQRYNRDFRAWLRENGVLDSILILNKFNITSNVKALYGIIANKYLTPLINAASKAIERVSNCPDETEDKESSLESRGEDKPLGTDGDGKSLGGANEENNKHMFMVMVVYTSSSFKSYINELSGYKECVFSKHLEESSVVMAMEYYLTAMEAGNVPKILEGDASILSMIYRDKFETLNLSSVEKYKQFKMRLKNTEKWEETYSSFKNLI